MKHIKRYENVIKIGSQDNSFNPDDDIIDEYIYSIRRINDKEICMRIYLDKNFNYMTFQQPVSWQPPKWKVGQKITDDMVQEYIDFVLTDVGEEPKFYFTNEFEKEVSKYNL